MPYRALLLLLLGLFPLRVLAQGTFVSLDPRYHLHAGDVLEVDFRLSPEFNATVPVQPDGYITLPNIGDAKVAGLTLKDATASIRQASSQLLNAPELTVELKQFENPYFVVGGQVNAPGRVELRGHMSILNAVQMAGGFKDGANTRQVILIHAVDQDRAETKVINYRRLVTHYAPSNDVEIHPGDLIFVPQNGVTQITPYIRLIAFGFYFNPLDF